MFAEKMTWTAERIETLKGHFEAGLTCSEIAADMGLSRNAVIGKLSRLNLTRFERAARAVMRADTPSAPRPKRITQHQIVSALPSAPVVQEALCTDHHCSLLELSEEKCRWPISIFGTGSSWFCGNARVKGLPYCTGHARVAYHHGVPRHRSGR